MIKNKEEFLKELRKELDEHDVLESVINDIINDYDDLYTSYLETGVSDEEIYVKLGSVKDIYKELRGTLSYNFNENIKKYNKMNILVMTAPFISLILFVLLGFIFNYWHPGWLLFLYIPMIAIITSSPKREKLVSLSPFIALIVFILIGYYTNIYHPTWCIFLIIIICGLFRGYKLSLYSQIISCSLLILAIILYVLLYKNSPYWVLVFLMPIISMLYFGYLTFFNNKVSNKGSIISVATLCIIAIYFILSFVTKAWNVTWLIILLIPIVGIVFSSRSKDIVLYVPLLAPIVFFILGFFFNLWHPGWLVFILVPLAFTFDKWNKYRKNETKDTQEIN